MYRKSHINLVRAIAFAVTVLSGSAALAQQSAADFYRGKTITFLVAAGAGGGYGLYARTTAQFLAKHIPGGPKIVMQFMPGAGGAKAANYMANAAPRDGSLIAMLFKDTALYQLLRGGVKFDALKFNYIGTVADSSITLMVWHTAPAKTLEDAKKSQVIVASSGVGDFETYGNPAIMNTLLGTKFKVVPGYRGGANMAKAMEGGEVHGATLSYAFWKGRRGAWLKAGKIRPLVQIGLNKHSDLPNVPLLLDLAKTDEERRILEFLAAPSLIGRNITVPESVPQDRIAALRKAFAATMKDPAFLAEAKKRKLEISPVPGVEVEKIVRKLFTASPEMIGKIKAAIGFK